MDIFTRLILMFIPTISLNTTITKKKRDLPKICFAYKKCFHPKDYTDDDWSVLYSCVKYIESKIFIRWWINFIFSIFIVICNIFFKISDQLIWIFIVILGIFNLLSYIYIAEIDCLDEKKEYKKYLAYAKEHVWALIIMDSMVSYIFCFVWLKCYFIDASNFMDFIICFFWQIIIGLIIGSLIEDYLIRPYLEDTMHIYEDKVKVNEISMILLDGTIYKVITDYISEDKECFFLNYDKERVIIYKKSVLKIIQHIDSQKD